MHNMINQNDHICNHNQPTERSKVYKLWDLLSYNQQLCDEIITNKLLCNIIKCNWTLKLQTQVEKCVTDQVGYMRSV